MYKIYSKPDCKFCEDAKNLLNSLNLPYEEFILNLGQKLDAAKQYVLLKDLEALVPNVRTVPQIFNDATYIGGFAELREYLKNA